MRRSLSNGEKVYVRSFSDATTDDMSFYAGSTSRRRPDRIYTGVEDLHKENDDGKITKGILTLVESIKSDENQFVISELISTANKEKQSRMKSINNILKDAGIKRKIGFIDNGDIDSQQHLDQSGLYLNKFGDAMLTSNSLSTITNNFNGPDAVASIQPIIVSTIELKV